MAEKQRRIHAVAFRTIVRLYSPKDSSLSIVGPLGLSGSLFLVLLVFDLYHPTDCDLYLVWVLFTKNTKKR